jgi:hypothetical protein
MSPSEKLGLKRRLKDFAISVLEQRIREVHACIENAQQNANQEEKSSAGDKYETSRAMSHLEKDMHARRLAENIKEMASLHKIDINTLYDKVCSGAFFETETGAYFIASGLGKQLIDGKWIIFLSPVSPLTGLLAGKKTGDSFLLKGIESVIKLII